MQMQLESADILVVGAGPAGSVAAALLHKQGRQVLVIEREQFPRFSIGESLLPQSMQYLEEAGMLRAVVEAAASGRDLLVSAQTGSGKTVAYGLAFADELMGEAETLGPAGPPLAL